MLDFSHRAWKLIICAVLCAPFNAGAVELADTIEKITPGVVAVGTYLATRRPPSNFLGSGFAVGDGDHIVTNRHVVPKEIDFEHGEKLTVFSGRGKDVRIHEAVVAKVDAVHDLALLKITVGDLKPLSLGDSAMVRIGDAIAFTGFPIGAVLGIYPATHRGMIASITPVALPATHSGELSVQQLKLLRAPFDIFQLDATAYPGNSGSPVFNPLTGEVIAVINMVYVKQSKENVLKDPSGIAYAIPSNFVIQLLDEISRP